MSLEQKIITPLIVPAIPNNQFLILHSKDMVQSDIDLLKDYGRVISYDHLIYNNIAINILDFDYMLLDLRCREDRHYYQKIEESFLEKCHVVSLCHSVEKFEDFHQEIGAANILTKLPDRQAFKTEFDRLLLLKKISKPSLFMSCFKSSIRLVRGDWK